MHPLEALNVTTRVVKRAQYEAFEFTVLGRDIQVRNCSHANPADHEYLVTVCDGLPVACSCPADARFDGACKHRVAVAIRRPVLDAASEGRHRTHLTDGGQQTTAPTHTQADNPTATEPFEALASTDCSVCIPTFPCWSCYREHTTNQG
jgi:hypothetical protein